jgi:hypothetical protein
MRSMRMRLAALLAAVLPVTMHAQTDSASARSRTGFDPATITAIRGVKVVRIDSIRGSGDAAQLAAVVTAGMDSIAAILGPADFLAAQQVMLKPGDAVDLAGSRVMVAGQPALLVTELLIGDKLVALRDKTTGLPLWRRESRPPE